MLGRGLRVPKLAQFLLGTVDGRHASPDFANCSGWHPNGLNVEAYLRHVLERLPDHPINRIEELLPWAVAADIPALRLAA